MHARLLAQSIFALVVFLFIGCQPKSDNIKITLEDWLSEKEYSQKISAYAQSDFKPCDSLESMFESLKTEEFKRRHFLDLAKCYLDKGKPEKAKKFMYRAFSAGVHISWIDSVRYASIYSEIKKEYPTIHKGFWSGIDTSYFQKIEKMANLDQALVGSPKKRDSVFKKHSRFLLDYTMKNGFPWRPLSPNYFPKKDFRVRIDPSIIAIHAPVKEKIILREYAIKSAKKGKNSWVVPISLGTTFFTQLPYEKPMPIRFVFFDETNKLNLEASYLQLYCIKEYKQDNDISQIMLFPAKANKMNEEVIMKELEQIKNALVKVFGLRSNFIQISSVPSSEEIERQKAGRYNYVFVKIP